MKKSLSRALPALLITLVIAAGAQAADFLDAYRAAMENDPVIAEARAKLEAAEQKIPQGRAGLLPTISASANSMYNHENVVIRDRDSSDTWDFDSHGVTLSLSQPIFRRQNWIAYDQSKLLVAQAEAAYESARQDLILRTARAYFAVLNAEQNVKSAMAYKQAVASQLTIATEAYNIGTGVRTDVFDAETRHDLAASQLIVAQTEHETSLRALESIIGPLPPTLAGKRPEATLNAPEPAEVSSWARAAEENNLAVLQQNLALQVATYEVDRQRAGHFPTLDLVASAEHTSTESAGDREYTDLGRVGLQLSLPIFQGGEVTSRQAEAAANRRAALAAVTAAQRQAALSAHEAYLGVVSGLAQIRTLRAALESAEKAQQSNRDAFDVGVRLSIDVLNAQAQVFNARRDLTRAVVDTVLAQLGLKAAVGALGENDVQAVNALLESRN